MKNMIKRVLIFLMTIVLIIPTLTLFVGAKGTFGRSTFKETESGVQFKIPEDWNWIGIKEQDVNYDGVPTYVFEKEKQDNSIFTFTYLAYKMPEKFEATGNEKLDAELESYIKLSEFISGKSDLPEGLIEKTYNGKKYICEITTEEAEGQLLNVKVLFSNENGYIHRFVIYSTLDTEIIDTEMDYIMQTVKYFEPEETENEQSNATEDSQKIENYRYENIDSIEKKRKTFVNYDNGMLLNIPTHWSFFKENDVAEGTIGKIYVFMRMQDDGATVMYSSMSTETDSAYNDENMTALEFAEALNNKNNGLEQVEHNGVTYSFYETREEDGTEAAICFCEVNNYIHTFYVLDDNYDAAVTTMNEFLGNVYYFKTDKEKTGTAILDENGDDITQEEITKNNKKMKKFLSILAVPIGVASAIIVARVGTAIISGGKKKKKQDI
jgi:hypothetical protein